MVAAVVAAQGGQLSGETDGAGAVPDGAWDARYRSWPFLTVCAGSA